MRTLVCEGFGVFIVSRVDIRSLVQRAFPCSEYFHYYIYLARSFHCRNSPDQGQSWSRTCFLIYSCVEAKQGHVRLVKSLLIPFSFLLSASYPVYAFWSSYSSVVDLKAYPLALWWNHQLYGVVIYEGSRKVIGFVKTVSFASCERVYQTFEVTLITKYYTLYGKLIFLR